jgi:hypothetical protein
VFARSLHGTGRSAPAAVDAGRIVTVPGVTPRRILAAVGAGAMLVAAVLPLPVTAAGAETVVSVPGSIDAGGGQDVTAALTSFFATVPAGATVRFPAGGRYRIDGVLFITGRHDVTIEGNGSTLVAPTDGTGTPVPRYNFRARWPRMRAHLDIEMSTGVTVRDLTVQGPNPAGTFKAGLEGQAGFVVSASSNVTLDHVTARATYGDGVYVIGHSTGVKVQSCTLDHNGRQGVAIVDGVDVTVQQCTIESPGRSAVDLEPARGAARSVHVQDNQVSNAQNFLLAASGAGSNVGDVWLERNHVTGGRGVSVFAGQKRFLRSGIHVLDNVGEGTSRGYQDALLRFERFDGIEIKGNRQAVAKGVTPIVLLDSCNPDVSGNDFGGASATPTTTGDCSTPGLAPATSSTTAPAGLGNAAARRAANLRRRAARRGARLTPPTTVAPVVVVRHRGGSSPVTIALAFLIGGLAGAGAVTLFQWSRANRDTGGRPPTQGPPSSSSSTPPGASAAARGPGAGEAQDPKSDD